MKDYIWAQTGKGLMVFNNVHELMLYKKRGDNPIVHDVGTYTAEDIAEVYAAKNAETQNIVSGVGGAKEFAKKDAKYWRDTRRKRFGRYVDTSNSERMWKLTKEQLAFYKAHPEISIEEITGNNGFSTTIKIEGRNNPMQKNAAINLTGLSPLEKRKILNKIQGIQAPREKPLPELGWRVLDSGELEIFGTIYAHSEADKIVERFYPLDTLEITKKLNEWRAKNAVHLFNNKSAKC
jgi:hypothetical protein